MDYLVETDLENINAVIQTCIKAVEQGLIELANDQRSFTIGKNKRKLFSVPFDENPYAALAAWFKTDEGVEIYKSVAKKLI